MTGSRTGTGPGLDAERDDSGLCGKPWEKRKALSRLRRLCRGWGWATRCAAGAPQGEWGHQRGVTEHREKRERNGAP